MLKRWHRKLLYARWHVRAWYAKHALTIKANALMIGLLVTGFPLGRCSGADALVEERELGRRNVLAVEHSYVRRERAILIGERMLREDLAVARNRARVCEDASDSSDAVAEEVRAYGEEALAQRRGGRR